MNTTEIIDWTRKEATLSSLSTEYPASRILQMANHTMTDVFEPIVANARSGYWLHTFTRVLGVGNQSVRLPPRSTPAIEQIDVSQNGADWVALTEALESEAQDWMNEYRRAKYPQAYVLRGSYIHLMPAAQIANISLRVKTTIRPSVLVEAQTAGLVTAVDYDNRILTVNEMPVSKPDDTTLSGAVTVDCIEPRGNFELSVLDASAVVLSSTTIQLDSGFSVQRVEVGDYVRAANQSDWPQLPEAFHKLVGSITAIPICTQRDLHERGAQLSTQNSNSLGRMNEHLRPRVRVQAHKPLQHNWR